MSALQSLADRELGKRVAILPPLEKTTQKRLDEEFGHTISILNAVKEATAIRPVDWDEIHVSVGDLIMNLLDNSDVNQLFTVNAKKKAQREQFVLNGGIDALMVLFRPPFVKSMDARKFLPVDVAQRSELWNEILVILREVAYVIPTLPDRIFNTEQMVFFFTMLCHQSLFDNTMNMLEEVLAAREDTFMLASIPDFYMLLNRFTSRQLAHFCRILSLVLFEPEDRQVMEGYHVLHSTELLQLRRNRMTRNCGGAVERNQSLIIEAPGVLERMVQILRVVNFGPNLAEMISHNIVSQMPITSDILTFFSSSLGVTDWDHFASLEGIIASDSVSRSVPASPDASPRTAQRAVGSPRTPPPAGTSAGAGRRDLSLLEDEDITAELLNSFSPTQSDNNPGGSRLMDLTNIVNVMQVARDLGIADMTPLGEALLSQTATPDELFLAQRARRTGGNNSARQRQSLLDIGPGRARKELQFHAMLLSPHQIELIFVLCTLLSGRRKIAVQQRLGAAGLDKVLLQMFDRMSWGSPPPDPATMPQHIHGPNCECDPESPVRVQFLRLVHNFYDRDFLGNENKLLMLSPAERLFVQQERVDMELPRDAADKRGLLSKVMSTLMKEPPESIYKFWLSACVENFLRGCGRMGQFMVSQNGVLGHTVKQIVDHDLESSASLQTFFDLLGEIVKCNHSVLEAFDAQLGDEDFAKLRRVVMKNLIDSNVFVRSLYLSVEMVSYSYAGCDVDMALYPHPTSGLELFGFHMNSLGAPQSQLGLQRTGGLAYLRDSWVQFEPTVLSKRAVPPSSMQVAEPSVGAKVPAKAQRSESASSAPGRSGIDNGESGASGSFSTGLMGALKDIRKATKHFLSFGDSAKPTPINSPEVVRKRAAESAQEPPEEKDSSGGEGEFFDCRSTPPNTKDGKFSFVGQQGGTTRPAVRIDLPVQQALLATVQGDDSERVAGKLRAATPLAFPENLSRIATFLAEEKVNVTLRLMSTVSLGTINHENICCLNTVIMMFLLEHKRGTLAELLVEVRRKADEEYIAAQKLRNTKQDSLDVSLLNILTPAKGDQKRCACCLDPRPAAAVTSSSFSKKNSDSVLSTLDSAGVDMLYCGTCDTITETVGPVDPPLVTTAASGDTGEAGSPTDDTVDLPAPAPVGSTPAAAGEVSTSAEGAAETAGAGDVTEPTTAGSEVLCRNFRELLWYWQQYYLRRGRDRLSIEFSVHIPFRYWQALVVLMCQDDGAPTSLLAAPMSLPPGPYQRHVPCHPAASPSDRNTLWNYA